MRYILAVTLTVVALTGCAAERPATVADADALELDADALLDRFAAYVARHDLEPGQRLRATDDLGVPVASGTRLVPLVEQDCPVSPPVGFTIHDVAVAPGRLACTWTNGLNELTLTVLLDADLRPLVSGAGVAHGIETTSGAAYVTADRLWLQDTTATRMLRAQLTTPPPNAHGAVPWVPPDLSDWVARLEPVPAATSP